jgi:hypothetical protein
VEPFWVHVIVIVSPRCLLSPPPSSEMNSRSPNVGVESTSAMPTPPPAIERAPAVTTSATRNFFMLSPSRTEGRLMMRDRPDESHPTEGETMVLPRVG